MDIQTNKKELINLLGIVFDAYEDGVDCYDDPEEGIYIGKAVRLDDATFHRIADILNKYLPRQG